MDAPDWEAETYKRFLMLIGGQETPERLDAARDLLRDFNRMYPEAKAKWGAYCASLGIKI